MTHYFGNVNDNGICQDTCPDERPDEIAGVCGKCELDKVSVGGICCPEGNVNDNGVCQDTCPSERPIIVKGVCGKCGLPKVSIGGINAPPHVMNCSAFLG